MKRILLALAILLLPSLAAAQCNGVFPNNTVCGNATGSSNTPRAVSPNVFPSNSPGGSTGQIQYNAGSGLFGGFTASGDCTITTSTGAVICLKTNGVSFGPPATGSRSGNTTVFTTTTGSLTSGDCVKIDANGNLIDAGSACASPSATVGIFSPITYGAKCDGSTHDEVAFQNALNAAIAASGVLQLPVGNCVLNANITDGTGLFASVTIKGYGASSSVTFLGSFGFNFAAEASYYNIQNFNIVCQTTSTTACLQVANATQSTSFGSIISGLIISQCGAYGMYFQNLEQANILNNWIITPSGGTAGIWIDNTQSADTGGNTIQGNNLITVSGTTTYGIHYIDAGGTNTRDNNIAGYIYDIYFQLTLSSGAATGILIQGNQLDNATIGGIYFNSTLSTGAVLHVNVDHNTIRCLNTGSGACAGIFFAANSGSGIWVEEATVNNNVVNTYIGNVGIGLNGGSNFTINGNAISDQGSTTNSGILTVGATCVVVGNVVSNYTTHLTNSAGCTVAGNN